VHHLTGEFVTEASTASRSLLVDLDTVSWDPELLDLFGLTGERMPRIAASDDLVGVG
jgi:glycerol kinase